MTLIHLGLCCKFKHSNFSSKTGLRLLQIILEIMEKRAPPQGAFKLNPLTITSVTDKQRCQKESPCSHTSLEEDTMKPEDAEMIIQEKQGLVTDNVNTGSDVIASAPGNGRCPKTDSSVMMKLVVSGPPSQVKIQKVLPESLLQKVTSIIRQQTNSQETVNLGTVSSQETQCSGSLSNTLEMVTKENTANFKQIEQSVPQVFDQSCNTTHSNALNNSTNTSDSILDQITCVNTDGIIVQSIAQSAENTFNNRQSLNTDLNSTDTTYTLNDTGESTNIESDKVINCISCSKLNSDINTCDFLTRTVETSHHSVSRVEIGMNIDSSEGIKEICGPPDSVKTDEEMIVTEITETGLKINDTETEINPFGSLFIDDVDSENDGSVAKAVKETDDVFNIAPLFTGELEKWRKRELRKEKTKLFKKKKKSGKHTVDKSAETSGEKDEEEKKKEHKPIPNYFVAIQITNPKIHSGLQQVQEDVVRGNEKLKPALNKLATLHLTLFVAHLNSDDEMSRAKQALDQCQQKLVHLYQKEPLPLDVSGLGNFRNNIVFAKINSDSQVTKLREIADIVSDCFLDQEIVSPEKPGSFKPHITVMKLTRDKSFRKKGGIKKIDEAFYKDHIDKTFGRQYANTLQLCAMLKKKAESGYYQVEHSVQFAPDISEDLNEKDVMDLEENTEVSAGEINNMENAPHNEITDTMTTCEKDMTTADIKMAAVELEPVKTTCIDPLMDEEVMETSTMSHLEELEDSTETTPAALNTVTENLDNTEESKTHLAAVESYQLELGSVQAITADSWSDKGNIRIDTGSQSEKLEKATVSNAAKECLSDTEGSKNALTKKTATENTKVPFVEERISDDSLIHEETMKTNTNGKSDMHALEDSGISSAANDTHESEGFSLNLTGENDKFEKV